MAASVERVNMGDRAVEDQLAEVPPGAAIAADVQPTRFPASSDEVICQDALRGGSAQRSGVTEAVSRPDPPQEPLPGDRNRAKSGCNLDRSEHVPTTSGQGLAAVMKARAAVLFPAGSTTPVVKPQQPPAAERATNELACCAFEAAKAVTLVRGQLAREEAVAYLLADALGVELLKEEALRLGESTRKAALAAKAAQEGLKGGCRARKAKLRKASLGDPRRAATLEAELQELDGALAAELAELASRPIALKGLPEKGTAPKPKPKPTPTPTPTPKMSGEAVCDEVWGSRQVACAIRDAKRLQRCWCWPLVLDEEGKYLDGTEEEETELAAAQYKYSVRKLATAFPKAELDVAALVKGVPCNNYNSEPCECGVGKCGIFPWEVWTEELGYCKCELAQDRDFELVDAWITGYSDDFAY